MSTDITPLNRSDVLDGAAKFFRIMEKEGVDWSLFQLPISSKTVRRNLAEYLKLGCPRVKKEEDSVAPMVNVADYELARTILGTDFISPEEITQARGLNYSDEQIIMFGDTLPYEEVITWCRKHDAVLIAGPPSPLSLLQIRDLRPEYFYSKSSGWYAERNQRFSREQKVETKWYVVRKGIVTNSTSRTWTEQLQLLSEVEYVPNDAELEWVLTTYKAVRNINLLSNVYARTASVDSNGNPVIVGDFDARGLSVLSHWDDDRYGSLGVASARKF